MSSSKVALPLALLALIGVSFACAKSEHRHGTASLLASGRTDSGGVPAFNPKNFGPARSNRLFPLVPGSRHEYRLDTGQGIETITVEVTHETKEILGVTTRVVRDVVWLDDCLIEETLDWIAADVDGNVWYFGEDSVELDCGRPVSTAGSWEAGLDGAMPGILMLAVPTVGTEYAQEYAPGIAEDRGQVLAVDESVTVPTGSYRGCLKTLDFTPLEPGREEHKFYAPGIGVVLEAGAGGARVELVSVSGLGIDDDADGEEDTEDEDSEDPDADGDAE